MSLMVALCGGDAAGKATQTQLLAERIGGTRFPFPEYATPTGEAILAHLKGLWSTGNPDDAMAFQCLQTVNRLEMLPAIRLALAEGPVVFDRWSASAAVYGVLDGLDPEWIERINASLPQPDVWILLDVPVDEGFKRRPDRRDRIESNRPYLEKVRTGYLELFENRRYATNTFAKPPLARWRTVDGTGSIEEVQARIWSIVEPLVRR